MTLPLIFDTCRPRKDVEAGTVRDDEFMADLSRVVNGTAPEDYLEPAKFFAKSYPTRGMKELLKAICLRLSGKGGEVSSIIRLGTQYGGGKTHALIALVHAVRGMQGVTNVKDFIDPAILPSGTVRVAALDGENADPANGLTLEAGLLAHSLWGEMAYRLAGRSGYERVRQSDEKHIAPGADTIRELFGGQPTLILLDEVSVYLRKVERAFPDASKQFAAFVHDLFKAVASTPRVALVYTLAIGKDDQGKRNVVKGRQCLSRYVIALPSPEFGSVLRSANASPTNDTVAPSAGHCAADETATAAQVSGLAHAPRHRDHILGRASPVHSGIRRESSPPLPRTVFFHGPGSWLAGSPLPLVTSERCAIARHTSE